VTFKEDKMTSNTMNRNRKQTGNDNRRKEKSSQRGHSRRVVTFQDDDDGHNIGTERKKLKETTSQGNSNEHNEGGDTKTSIKVDALGRQIDSSLSLHEVVSINLGMLKCGFRYTATVILPFSSTLCPLEPYPLEPHLDSDKEIHNHKTEMRSNHLHLKHAENLKVLASIDEDLRTEVLELRQKRGGKPNSRDDNNENFQKGSGSPNEEENIKQNMEEYIVILQIHLAARRPGPYRGRFVLEWANQGHFVKIDENLKSRQSSSSEQKALYTSVQIDAMLMDKDKGTPCLKSNIRCAGKLVGYDSDEDTDWQGFD